jgi:hypothetical protein
MSADSGISEGLQDPGAPPTGNGRDDAPAALPVDETATDARISSTPSAALNLSAMTLMGDMRDFMLELVRDQREPWHKLSESQQSYVAQRIEDRCRETVNTAVTLIAGRDFAAIPATLKECKIKDGIEAKVVLSRYDENRHELLDASGSEILIILADAKAFLGARAPAKIDRQALFDAPPVETEPAGDAAGPLFAAAVGTVEPDLYAQSVGKEDGASGNRDHAARYPAGTYGHADYELGHAEGQRGRHPEPGEGDPPEEAAPVPKRRGRPRRATVADD